MFLPFYFVKKAPNETVEKVPFQKLPRAKWEKTIENRRIAMTFSEGLPVRTLGGGMTIYTLAAYARCF
jgi:hypothetical protein